MRRERPSAHVFEPERFPLVIPEAGDREIEVAIAVQIARSHVGNPRDGLCDHVARKPLGTVVFKDDDRPDSAVVRKQRAETCDHQVQVAVAVEIHCLDVRRRQDLAGDRVLGIDVARELADPGNPVCGGVAHQDVREAVLVEVGDLHVRDLGPLMFTDRIACGSRREERSRSTRKRSAR